MSNQYADSNRVSLRAIAEATDAFGVTPASGISREVRYTSSSLSATKETAISDELRADRMVDSVVEVSASSAGDVNIEMSAGSHDPFLAAFVLGSWSQDATLHRWVGSSVSITGNDAVAISGGDYSDYFTAGQVIKLEGFATFANNRYATVASVAFSANVTTVTVSGTPFTAEGGTARTAVMDANDVLVLGNTDIRAGQSGNTFDSNGNDAFASLVAAEKLVAGQKIFVEGLGFETGTVVFGPAAPDDGTQVTVSDGVDAVVFQFGGTIATGVVDAGSAASIADAADQLAAAVSVQYGLGTLEVRAISDNTDTVTFTNMKVTGGSIADDDPTNTTTTDFSGGDATQRGVFTIASATDDVITVVESVGSNANGDSNPVTIKGSMLRNPGDIDAITPQSFTVQEHYTDIGQVFTRKGMRVGTFQHDVSSGAIVTGSYGLQGTETQRGTTATLSESPYTVLEAPATQVVNATTNVGTLSKDGAALSTALQSISLSGEANLRNQFAVGSKFPTGIGTGRFNLSGSMTAYFEDGALFDDFLEHAVVSLGYSFVDAHQNTYYWTIPSAHITTDDISPGGIDQDVLENLEFVAKRDSQTDCMLQVDRFSSVKAPTA